MHLADSNILLYAVSADPDEAEKRVRAIEVLADRDNLALSVQVLQEFYHQATRPRGRLAFTHERALTFLAPLMRLPIQPVTQELFTTAAGIADRYGVSYWDAAILAAAIMLGCDAVYSEDLSHQQDYDGLTVINPFLDETGPE